MTGVFSCASRYYTELRIAPTGAALWTTSRNYEDNAGRKLIPSLVVGIITRPAPTFLLCYLATKHRLTHFKHKGSRSRLEHLSIRRRDLLPLRCFRAARSFLDRAIVVNESNGELFTFSGTLRPRDPSPFFTHNLRLRSSRSGLPLDWPNCLLAIHSTSDITRPLLPRLRSSHSATPHRLFPPSTSSLASSSHSNSR